MPAPSAGARSPAAALRIEIGADADDVGRGALQHHVKRRFAAEGLIRPLYPGIGPRNVGEHVAQRFVDAEKVAEPEYGIGWEMAGLTGAQYLEWAHAWEAEEHTPHLCLLLHFFV